MKELEQLIDDLVAGLPPLRTPDEDAMARGFYRRGIETGMYQLYEAVCRKAEDKMLKTGKLEGAHYAAMRELLGIKEGEG